jgi:hypothetical protein
LFEEKATGLTSNYIRVKSAGERPGSLAAVTLTPDNILAMG